VFKFLIAAHFANLAVPLHRINSPATGLNGPTH
jgi:hypothetical protein